MPHSQAAPIARFVAKDPRADSGSREISIAADAIAIDRRVAGVKMRLSVPTRSFRGVALTVRECSRGFCYRVALVHGDAELNVVLAETELEADAVAEWQAWAKFFGLARLVQRAGGSVEAIERSFGEVTASEVQPRRRGWPLKDRRSAISARRLPGSSGAAEVHRAEREIICYE